MDIFISVTFRTLLHVDYTCDEFGNNFVLKIVLFLHTRPECLKTRPGLGNVVLHEGV